MKKASKSGGQFVWQKDNSYEKITKSGPGPTVGTPMSHDTCMSGAVDHGVPVVLLFMPAESCQSLIKTDLLEQENMQAPHLQEVGSDLSLFKSVSPAVCTVGVFFQHQSSRQEN